MSLDEVKKRFVEEVKLRAYDDKYIDKNEEREILQIALQQGVTVDSARGALAQVCEGNGYVLETPRAGRHQGPGGNLRQQRRQDRRKGVQRRRRPVQEETHKARRTTSSANAWSSRSIEENSYKVKTGMFSNWYAKVKKDVGMA